jgi:hypothetical protein
MRAATLFFSISLALVSACDRSNPEPPDAARPPRDGGSDVGPVDAPTDAPVAVDAPLDAPPIDAPGLDAPLPDGGPLCDDPSGCWACEATNDDQFLNHCTDATCEPFVNDTTRLPLLNTDGTLPPLP